MQTKKEKVMSSKKNWDSTPETSKQNAQDAGKEGLWVTAELHAQRVESQQLRDGKEQGEEDSVSQGKSKGQKGMEEGGCAEMTGRDDLIENLQPSVLQG